MSITDELREWWVRKFPIMDKELHKDFTAIADRIDAAVDGMIELPKDADGEYIHVGDVMEPNGANSLFGQASFEVRAMRYDEGGWEVFDRLGDRYAPSVLRHYHAPTVEDVLREFADEVYADADNEIRDRDFLCAKYAKRLTLAETEDA